MRPHALCLMIAIAHLAACGPIISSPFFVDLTLDQQTLAEIQRYRERVAVVAYYYGDRRVVEETSLTSSWTMYLAATP